MKLKSSLLVVAILLGSLRLASGAQVAVNLEKMTTLAGDIVTGRCIDVKQGVHPEYENIKVTFVSLEVIDAIKGDGKSKFEFMQYGNGLNISTLPNYTIGEESIFFLYPKSRYGFTSPVGGHQGKLKLQRVPATGKMTVVKGLHNMNMFKNFNLKKLLISNDGSYIVTPSENIFEYDALKSVILKIIDHNSGQVGAK